MRRVLVTGAAGFIGSNLVKCLLKSYQKCEIVALDALTYAGNLENIESCFSCSNFEFVHGSVTNKDLLKSIFKSKGIDSVVHLAAESHVDRSILDTDTFIQTNVFGSYCLLEAVKEAWIEEPLAGAKKIVQVSTDEVYGELKADSPSFVELSPFRPKSPYSASKAAADHLAMSYHHTYGIDISIARCSNNFGPFQFPEKLIPLAILNVLQNKSIPLYGDGNQIRDWIFVGDCTRGIVQVVNHGSPGDSYNIGANCEIRNVDLVKKICGIIDKKFWSNPDLISKYPKAKAAASGGSSSLIQFVKDRPGHDYRYSLDCKKAKKELGFAPNADFNSALNETVDWYLSNESWWKSVMDGSYQEWVSKQYGE